jgi:hypothetical protein
MIDEKHPALLLAEDFCTYYTERNLYKLVSLLDSKATFILWDSNFPSDQIIDFEKELKKDWALSFASTLEISDPLILSQLPSCWALGFFNLKRNINEDLFTSSQLKGNLLCRQEDGNWKIKEIRFVPKFIPQEITLETAL